MSKKDAEYWRNRRKRLREQKEAAARAAQAVPQPTPQLPTTLPRVAPADRVQAATRLVKATAAAQRRRNLPLPVRRRRMKSDQEVKNGVTGIVRMYYQQPKAMVHAIAGYVRDLQELMKRDREDEFAEKACQGKHPGRLAQGTYCKLCHDAEMANKFGSLPPEAIPPDQDDDDDDDDLDMLGLGAAPGNVNDIPDEE